jgi:hypothetical protein
VDSFVVPNIFFRARSNESPLLCFWVGCLSFHYRTTCIAFLMLVKVAEDVWKTPNSSNGWNVFVTEIKTTRVLLI